MRPRRIDGQARTAPYRKARKRVLARPLLFIHGRRKLFSFHSPTWATGLGAHPGRQVVAVEAGHRVMKEEPAIVNEVMLRWLTWA